MNTVTMPSPAGTSAAFESLSARQAELLARLADAQRATLALAEAGEEREVADFKDEAQRAGHELLGDAQAQRDHAQLVEVRAAIARLQEGRYGLCLDCGEPVGEQRLRLLPWASRCTACQTAHEAQPGPVHGG